MHSIDSSQFSVQNTKLFSIKRWYLFLDSYEFVNPRNAGGEYYCRAAHKCKPLQKDHYNTGADIQSGFECCIVQKKGRCQDCNAVMPEEIQALWRLHNMDVL